MAAMCACGWCTWPSGGAAHRPGNTLVSFLLVPVDGPDKKTAGREPSGGRVAWDRDSRSEPLKACRQLRSAGPSVSLVTVRLPPRNVEFLCEARVDHLRRSAGHRTVWGPAPINDWHLALPWDEAPLVRSIAILNNLTKSSLQPVKYRNLDTTY